VLRASHSYHPAFFVICHTFGGFLAVLQRQEKHGNSALLAIFGASEPVPAIPCRQSQTADAAFARICQRCFPREPEEIAHFETMLRSTARNMTEADIEHLLGGLRTKKK
jgi:hypothetical protein